MNRAKWSRAGWNLHMAGCAHRVLLPFTLCVAIGGLAGRLSPAGAAQATRNELAIRQVASGELREAKASWWGFELAEATAALQAAIDSRAARLIVDRQAGPWIVDELRLRSEQEIVFEPGVEILAKAGAFRSTSAALFTARDCKNLKLIGPGATLRMRRDDYARAPYQKAEWRHVLNLRGCEDVLVSGLTLAESGGDGIYIAPGAIPACRRVVIRDVVCDKNYRQGISVISAEDLLIERCTLKNTAGTAPAAGIDFEPNHANERLVDCVMRDCVIEDNHGYALHIYARNLTGASPDMGIRVEGCVTRGRNARSVSIVTSNGGPQGPVRGRIEFVNCSFEDIGTAGLVIGSKPVNGARVRFENCAIADPEAKSSKTLPIQFNSRPGDTDPVGGVEFVQLLVREQQERPLLRFDDRAGLSVSRVTGSVVVQRGNARQAISLDDDVLDRWIPSNLLARVPSFDVSKASLQPVDAAAESRARPTPHRLRDTAVFWIYARAGEKVECRLAYAHVGSGGDAKAMDVEVTSPDGRTMTNAKVPLDQQATVTFSPTASGTYRVACSPRQHTAQMVSCSHAFCIGGGGTVIHFIATTGDFFFWIPPGTNRLAWRAQGEGEGERVGVALYDERSREVWNRPNLGGPEYQLIERPDAAAGAVWRLHISKPPQGVLEDHYLELRGVPAVLGFSAESLLRPAPRR